MTDDTPGPAVAIDPHAGSSHRTIRGWVFWPAAGIALAFIAFALFFPTAAEATFATVQTFIVSTFNWYYVLIAAFFVVFALAMGFSRFGNIKLGQDDDEPEFSTMSWFALLFAAGMGIGLVFYGVSEPLSHFVSPRPGVEGTPAEIAQQAMSQTFLHWGVHAWSIYVVLGLALAYAFHRRRRPRTIRWALEPILGARLVQGGWGNAIDVAALVGTLFGVATSLGLGVIQISAGLDFLGVVPPSIISQAIIIGIITGFVLFSLLSGVGKGMKWLSNINLVLAGLLMLFLLFVGPTEFLLRDVVQSIGNYIQSFVGLSFTVSAYAGDDGVAWQGAWTAFYWGWWISWAPFVGIFIARISRGRTVREFVVGVILVPTLVGILWFTVLGGTAIYGELTGTASYTGPDGSVDVSTALFQMLENVPASGVLIVGFLILIAVFFVTSADSGALVMSMIATGGEETPKKWVRVFFALATAVIAFALLIAGGLNALQTAAISIALPFSIVLLAICWATVVAFRREMKAYDKAERAQLRDSIGEHYGLEVEEPNQRGIFGIPARWRHRRSVAAQAEAREEARAEADKAPEAVSSDSPSA
ncbi:BCCT family transporter [Microbacterium sp. P26]|uniref:BCCT family transporter n=1 Tax=Microbacterium TaxID=33882 RepID=UPI00203FE82A|nr:BCCT family transporter [Microbacterium sp. P26]MCM3501222.1 BCCT family transporter [Microbacterium sp. P26]